MFELIDTIFIREDRYVHEATWQIEDAEILLQGHLTALFDLMARYDQKRTNYQAYLARDLERDPNDFFWRSDIESVAHHQNLLRRKIARTEEVLAEIRAHKTVMQQRYDEYKAREAAKEPAAV